MRLIIDAHLDLSMNAMEWNRDLRLPLSEINEREQGMKDKPDRRHATVSFDSLRKGNIGLVVGTQIARVIKPGSKLPGWYSPEQAWAQTQAQLSWYLAMEEERHLRRILGRDSLEKHLKVWPTDGKTLGMVLSLEGADSLVNVNYLEKAYGYGLRALGPGHYGPGRYANGTDSSGQFNAEGKELLKEMESLQIILDATHLNDDAFWEAVPNYRGPVWASHNNCRSLVPHNRQFSDDMIRALLEREAVIGVALDAWMLIPGWTRGVSTPKNTQCTLQTLADHIDHICQIAGNTLHVGIGSDLDGAFGTEQCPLDLKEIADLQKLFPILKDRGYSDEDLDRIAHENFLRFLRGALPKGQ
jgi:membrane dipeptidase